MHQGATICPQGGTIKLREILFSPWCSVSALKKKKINFAQYFWGICSDLEFYFMIFKICIYTSVNLEQDSKDGSGKAATNL